MGWLVLVVAVALITIQLVFTMDAAWPGVSSRVGASVLGAAAVASFLGGAWLWWPTAADERSTSCRIVSPEVRRTEDGLVLVARLRWTVEGKSYTLHQPRVLGSASHDERAALVSRYAEDAALACWYRAGVPNTIRQGSLETYTASSRWIAAGLELAAGALVVAARRMWRRARVRRVVRTAGARGELGIVLLAMVVVGLVVGTTIGHVIAGAIAVLWLGLIVRETVVAGGAITRVQRRMDEAEPWEGAGLLASATAVKGRWNGSWVWIAETMDGVRVVTVLAGWPDALRLVPRKDDVGGETGDGAFDRAVRVIGDDLVWRPVLTAKIRERVAFMFSQWSVSVENRTLEIEIDDAESDELEQVLDAATAIASDSHADDPAAARVLELASAEPVAAVRWGHYRWLAEGSLAPLAYRAAAADPDPEIAAWGKAQLAPDAGPFR